MYTYKIFEALNEECKNLLIDKKKNFTSTFFQDFHYLEELIKNTNNINKIIVIYQEKQVLAVLPLEIKKYYFLNVLQWIGTGKADYCNPILIKDFNSRYNKGLFLNVWNKILKEIKREIDIIFLNNQLNSINNVLNPFADAFETSKFSSIYKIYFAGSFDEYFDTIKKKDKRHSYEIHRTLLKLKKLKNVSKKLSFETKDFLDYKIDFKKNHAKTIF